MGEYPVLNLEDLECKEVSKLTEGGAVSRASDLRLRGWVFDFWLGTAAQES